MNELEEIKSKIDIVEYIGAYTQLKQTGKNFKACCPFHHEKTPSFIVSPDRQRWHCFGACNEGGDVFTFAMKMDSLSFPEAVEMLAAKAGVTLAKKNFEKNESTVKLYSANALAADFYSESLNKEVGKKALEYLKDRGLTDKTIKEYGLGYSTSEKDALQKELKKHSLGISDLEKAGLAANKSGEWRDFFWGRLMFPIRDITGRTVGFSARTLEKDGIPKYINTTETEIYHKSNILYGIDLAKESARKADNVILVEGQMDVIASHQAGVKNVVAPGGTALTENQLRLLSRLTKNLKLAFDIDFAGSEATRRAIELAWNMGFNIKIIIIPSGKDPADAVAENPEVWKAAVKNAVYVVDYLFDQAFARYKREDPIGRKKIGAELLPVIHRIPDEIEKDTYIKKLAQKLSVDQASIMEALKKVGKPKEQGKEETRPTKKDEVTDHIKDLEKNILGLLMIFPHYLDFAAIILAPEDFSDKETGQGYKNVLDYYQDKGEFSENKFLTSKKSEEREFYELLTLAVETNFADFDEEKKAEEIYFGVKRIKKLSLERKKKHISEEVASLEKSGNKTGREKLLLELQKLYEEERNII